MKPEDAEEYTQSLGQIVAGSWRQVALAKRLGVPKALGLSIDQWVNDRLGGYVKLSIAERREAVAQLTVEGHSQREIGSILGVGQATVHRDASDPNGSRDEQEEPEFKISNDPNGSPLDAVAALAADEKIREKIRGTQGTGEPDWHTPEKYLASARAVMGSIDVDPATSLIAQERVRAAQFFTKDDDGLKAEWRGNVWLNPPYMQPAIEEFARKMVTEVQQRRAVQGIMLTHNYTDTTWFHHAQAAASLVCFTKGRIGFISPEGKIAAPTQGQAFFYFGRRSGAFRKEFSKHGFVR